MNIAVVFAGGVGTRMRNTGKPKQFLEVNGKPIIIHTLEVFESHPDISTIVIPCVDGWHEHLQMLLDQYRITKVERVLSGGRDTQESKLRALEYLAPRYDGDSLVIVHDAVRPLITEKMITDNLTTASEQGNAVSFVPFRETGILSKDRLTTVQTIAREELLVAAAPQTFRLAELYDAHTQGQTMDPRITIDSCSLMVALGREVHLVECETLNIKITTPEDYFHFKSILELRESTEAFGL